jgi:hypothetical protein
MAGSPFAPTNPGPPYRDKREVPRYGLIASAEIIEPTTETHIHGRISEISRKGCYVDVLNTLPVGTSIQVIITRDLGTFSSPAKVIYTQEGMGMGVAFVEPAANQLKMLEAWLAELHG